MFNIILRITQMHVYFIFYFIIVHAKHCPKATSFYILKNTQIRKFTFLLQKTMWNSRSDDNFVIDMIILFYIIFDFFYWGNVLI
jgi:hypothetical protein